MLCFKPILIECSHDDKNALMIRTMYFCEKYLSEGKKQPLTLPFTGS